MSDDFNNIGQQTPTFVTQADFTEIFVPVTEALQKAMQPFLIEHADKSPLVPTKSNLAERIKDDASRYFDREEAMKIVEFLATKVESLNLSDELSGLYSVTVSREEKQPPQPEVIGEWIKKNRDDTAIFAKHINKREFYTERVPKFSVQSVTQLYSDNDYNTVQKQRIVTGGFENTAGVPFTTMRVRLTPLHRNIAPEECYLVPLISKTSLWIFYAFAHFIMTDWEKSQRIGKISWKFVEIELSSSELGAELDEILSEFMNFVKEELLSKFPNNNPQE